MTWTTSLALSLPVLTLTTMEVVLPKRHQVGLSSQCR